MPVEPVKLSQMNPGSSGIPVADAAAAREAPGWYGKISTLGDFAQRRLPVEFVQVSDAWLSRTLLASHQQLGNHWLDCYLTAPPMRFAWAPGVAGAHWWFGVLMPSCDNVGRYFPLLIAQRRTSPPLDAVALNHLEQWFDHLVKAATLTLGERATVEAFEQALDNAPPWPAPSHASGATAALPAVASSEVGSGSGSGTSSASYAFGYRVSVGEWLHGVALDALKARVSGCSIWWRQGDATRDTEAEVVRGLPEPAAFARMLLG